MVAISQSDNSQYGLIVDAGKADMVSALRSKGLGMWAHG